MTTGACSDFSFWRVKAGTKSSRIARWMMQVCTTSGGNNQTNTRYSEWQFIRSRKQWIYVMTVHSIEVKSNSQDWKNCWKSHSMSSRSLCYLDIMITPKIRINISWALRSIQVTSPQVFYLFASWTTHDLWFPRTATLSPITSCTSRTWPYSNNESITRMMWRIEISPETRSVGSVTSLVHKQLPKSMKYKCIEIR